MTAFALARTAVLLAATVFVGCASDPDLPRAIQLEPGRPTRVTLHQVRERQTFLLQNASSTEAVDFYDGDMPPLAKIAPDARLQVLLDIFAEKGMFTPRPGTVPADARDVLTVEHAGRSWIWARRAAATAPDQAAFHEARAYFFELYNQSIAYHTGTAVDRQRLKAERERAQRDADAARSRLEQLQEKPR